MEKRRIERPADSAQRQEAATRDAMRPQKSNSNTVAVAVATAVALAWAVGTLVTRPLLGEPSTSSPPTADAARAKRPSPHVVADLNLELIWVEAGTFTMGSPPDEPSRHKAEGPQRRVTLTTGYWLGKTEVTQGHHEAVMKTNPSTFQAAGPDAPVERVSWIQAMAFCRALTERERNAGRLPAGYHFTLPTEAQWEYACRAGTTDHYAGEPNAMTWWAENSGETTHPVGLKKPNAWGFHDMSGNVLEWCLDWYGDYPRGPQVDPSGPERGYYRIARGGSWRTDLRLGRSAARSGGSPGRLDYTLGFRLALVAD